MAKAEPQRWLIVDASQTVDQMQAQIRARIDQILASR
jgi:thymidylate kinase